MSTRAIYAGVLPFVLIPSTTGADVVVAQSRAMAAGAIGAIIGFSTAAGDAVELLGASTGSEPPGGHRRRRARYAPTALGELALQTIAMPKDTNANGDIFGGWLPSQMDQRAALLPQNSPRGGWPPWPSKACRFSPCARGCCRAATAMCWRRAEPVRILVEVWINAKQDGEPLKVTEGEFIYVAIDENKSPADSAVSRPAVATGCGR